MVEFGGCHICGTAQYLEFKCHFSWLDAVLGEVRVTSVW